MLCVAQCAQSPAEPPARRASSSPGWVTVTAPTAPHDAFRRQSQLAMLDAQIRIRHESFLAAVALVDMTAAIDRQDFRDELLDERHALTQGG